MTPRGGNDAGAPGELAIIGAGPAGLTAAYEAQRIGAPYRPHVYEAGALMGGISRTESYKGFRFDIGGHRFFTKSAEVQAMWREVMGDDFITVKRRSRIYYRGRFFNYPIKLFNALGNLGPFEAARIVASYLKWRLRPRPVEETFEDWVINRFGGRLYMHFFATYTEKVWGVPPNRIQADWAAQRIADLSLAGALKAALLGGSKAKSLIEEFQYPRLGPGMMWEKVRDRMIDRGGAVSTGRRVTRICWSGNRVKALEIARGPGEAAEIVEPDQVVNTMPLRNLIECFDPPPPEPVRAAAARLTYRDFLIVTLVLDHPDPFPDNWIYVHDGAVNVGRIQNFRAWSAEMVPDPDRASIGMEYFCNEGDAIWSADDADLRAMAGRELEMLGLAAADTVVDGTVIRQPKAYPVYDAEYRDAVATIRDWLSGLKNFQTVGRAGLHRYNNQDHSMLTAIYAARNLTGARHDVWEVNLERSYHESFERPSDPVAAVATA